MKTSTALLSTALGSLLALSLTSVSAYAADDANMEKCYGVAKAGKNDCAEGVHSCAGQATVARDPKSFVLLPAGVCGKIQGGKTTAT